MTGSLYRPEPVGDASGRSTWRHRLTEHSPVTIVVLTVLQNINNMNHLKDPSDLDQTWRMFLYRFPQKLGISGILQDLSKKKPPLFSEAIPEISSQIMKRTKLELHQNQNTSTRHRINPHRTSWCSQSAGEHRPVCFQFLLIIPTFFKLSSRIPLKRLVKIPE